MRFQKNPVIVSLKYANYLMRYSCKQANGDFPEFWTNSKGLGSWFGTSYVNPIYGAVSVVHKLNSLTNLAKIALPHYPKT